MLHDLLISLAGSLPGLALAWLHIEGHIERWLFAAVRKVTGFNLEDAR